MLGIGIDDMFVIVQSWETLKPEERSLSLIERFGVTMRHAGAAITVTSVTDIIAFGIGGFTVLPALQSFCIYASVGIVVMHMPDQNLIQFYNMDVSGHLPLPVHLLPGVVQSGPEETGER